jgi:uncharacterized protein (TIGR02099 family)
MFKKYLHWVYKLSLFSLMLFIVLIGASIITLQYFVLPNIDNYKPKIIHEISSALGQKVTVGKIVASWQGINPHLTLNNIHIYDQENRVALNLNRIETSLSWLSIPLLEPRLSSIDIHAPELIIRRITDGTIFVGGISMSSPSQSEFPNWLLRQNAIHVMNANVVWQDELRAAPTLQLNKLNLSIENPAWDSLRGHHHFDLSAEIAAASAKPFNISGHVYGRNISEFKQWHGSIFAKVEDADLTAWQPWLDYPIDLRQGNGSASLWLDFDDAQIDEINTQLALNEVLTSSNTRQQDTHFQRLAGHLKWERHRDGQSFSGEKLNVTTADGLNIQNGHFAVRERIVKNTQWLEGNIQLEEIQLQALNKLLPYFPMPSKIAQLLNDAQPQGHLNQLSLSWKSNQESLTEYAFKANFSELGMQAFATYHIPGFENLKGNLDINETNGKIIFDTQKSTLDIASVFRWPIPVEKIQGKVTWRNDHEKINVHATKLAIKTPDIEGVIDGYFSATNLEDAYIDLNAHFDNANLKNTKRYLPTILGQDTLNWIDTSILDGRGSNANLTLKGKLSDFPYTNKKGIFRVTAKASNVLLDHSNGWPKIEGINLNMLFEGKRMEINASAGHAFNNKIIKAKVTIPDLVEAETKLDIIGEAQGLVAEGIQYINASPIAKMSGDFTKTLKTSGNGKLSLNIHIPLYHLESSKINGTYTVTDGKMSSDFIPEISKINGDLKFTENSIDVSNVNAFILEGPAQFNVKTNQAHAIEINAHGKVGDVGLRKAFPTLPNDVTGSTEWKLKGFILGNTNEINLSSNLIGIASKLPAPFKKTADERLNLQINKKQIASNKDLISASLGGHISGKFLATSINNATNIDSGEIAINLPASIPTQKGIFLKANLSDLDIDEWMSQTDKKISSSNNTSSIKIDQIALYADHIDLFEKRLNTVKLKAKLIKQSWQIDLESEEVSGDIKWLTEGNGKVSAKLSHLLMPSNKPNAALKTNGAIKQLNINYPELDISADNFEIGSKKFGRLILQAKEQKGNWSINELRISNADATLVASGEWNNWKVRPNTLLRFNWKINNLGQVLKRLNNPNVIKNGSAEINGQLRWPGSPHEFEVAKLNGSLKLDVQKGQVLQVEPGVGRLFSILSLQNLPRRLMLDFRDLFSKGFSFDAIKADVRIQQGIMYSDNFKMEGPTAKVEIKGEVDLDKETQHLYIKASPYISDTLSLAAFAGGPAIGAAAYIAQKVFKDPLNKIAETEYEIVGTWRNPQEKDKAPSPPAASSPLINK